MAEIDIKEHFEFIFKKMAKKNTISSRVHPLARDGTSQDSRFLEALAPDNARVMDLSLQDWMAFACRYAANLKFFDPQNLVSGSWQPLWPAEEEVVHLLTQMEDNDAHDPHITLFLCFLKLLEHSNAHMNTLTQRHLDFYFKQVLRLKTRPARGDKVHIIFELARNATEQYIPA